MENLQIFQFLNFFNKDTTQLEHELSKYVYTDKVGIGWIPPDEKHKDKLSFLHNDVLVLCVRSKHIESCNSIYVVFNLKDKWLFIAR